MMEATVIIRTFKAAEIFQYAFPDLCLKTILSQRLTDNSFDFMLGVCALTRIVNCGTLYKQVFAFLNHVQSTEFTSGGLHLSCRNISRTISGKYAPQLKFELHGKGCEHVCKCDFNLKNSQREGWQLEKF
ncbi:hypothetical protein ATANTOWER_008739 [Ataeniobius toweri]|uniref:Uncharacterized protein n=1 Tax=Ataeniobius toweri TaxID=208326 RepID=A0ABU7BHW9_9TELE|nr:hypothetical protein [Ataeniobius toweri]